MLLLVSRIAVLAASLVFFHSGMHGQSLTGRISGTLTDVSRAAVAGAKVNITQIEAQAVRTAVTDDKGFYSVENLRIGLYTVEVNQSGFRRSAQTGLVLTGDGRITADFQLQVGDLSQNISVAATSEGLNSVSGEVSHVIDQKQVDNLPLNGRNYMQLLTLVPGATVTNPDQFSVMTSLSATNQVVNGHRSNQNSLTMDGLGNLDAGANGSLINNVSPDFMQEVKIQTSNFSASMAAPPVWCSIWPLRMALIVFMAVPSSISATMCWTRAITFLLTTPNCVLTISATRWAVLFKKTNYFSLLARNGIG